MRNIRIKNLHIGDHHPVCIVFECGPTHNGLLSAKKLVDIAFKSGVKCIKFQMLSAEKLVSDKKQVFKYSILTNRETDESAEIEESLYEILRRRELSKEEWAELANYINSKNMIFICTVLHKEDIPFLKEIGCDSLKIASADIDFVPILKAAANSGLNVQIDTGSSSLEEILFAVKVLEENGCQSLIIHHCPSGYPARLESINIKMIKTLRDVFQKYPIAFSDHTPDADMDIAAITQGVNLVEKTITEDRATKSVEHIFSLENNEIKNFVKRIKDLEIALGSYNRTFSKKQVEKTKLIRRSAHTVEPILKGEKIDENKISFMRPGTGFSSPIWIQMIEEGEIYASKNLPKGHILKEKDITMKR